MTGIEGRKSEVGGSDTVESLQEPIVDVVEASSISETGGPNDVSGVGCDTNEEMFCDMFDDSVAVTSEVVREETASSSAESDKKMLYEDAANSLVGIFRRLLDCTDGILQAKWKGPTPKKLLQDTCRQQRLGNPKYPKGTRCEIGLKGLRL